MQFGGESTSETCIASESVFMVVIYNVVMNEVAFALLSGTRCLSIFSIGDKLRDK